MKLIVKKSDMIESDFPFTIIVSANTSSAAQPWLHTVVGTSNYRYSWSMISFSDNIITFKYEEDAIAFALKFR